MTGQSDWEQRCLDAPTRVAHRIVSLPWVYDLVQLLVGVRQVHRRLVIQFAALFSASSVLDLGGGTGLLRKFWRPDCAYLCLDNDSLKLQGFRTKYPTGLALLSDATQVSLKSESVDVVLCVFVAHHIPDALLAQLIDESARVLKDKGRLVLVDALWAPARQVGRLLWKYDRGSHPRTAKALQSAITRQYSITHWERFAVYHEYLLCVATKRSGRGAS
jgi:ubiquinone/menaquinone biosynthesis C-methylase UbiE